MDQSLLGNWAVIDIETTGIDALNDSIIDIGFLQFEGTNLVKKYSSLVQFEGELSYFIQKLTGLNTKMLKKAPAWKQVENDVQELYGHHLLAHNADFEKSFLEKSFTKIEKGNGPMFEGERESYEDSLFFLSLLFPHQGSLKLENFIREWKIREKEEHRGFSDSLDLLKVMMVATAMVIKDRELYFNVQAILKENKLEDLWLFRWLQLSLNDLTHLAHQVEFDLTAHVEIAKASKISTIYVDEEVEKDYKKRFNLEFSGQNIKDILRNTESLKEIFPQYIYRQSQEELALRTGQAFKNKIHTLVQAPTGTGKTFGYLIPGALFAHSEKQQVLVSTGTKTLQNQAYEKDVPKIREMLGLSKDELKVKMLVGSSNHLCELLFRQKEAENSLFKTENFEECFASAYFSMLFFYNTRLPLDKAITRLQLPFLFLKKYDRFRDIDRESAVDFRSCTGNLCPFKKNCTYLQGLREAKEADVVIGNHSLMFSWPKITPRPQYIIVDEAHKIEEEATDAFGIEISREPLKSLVRNIQSGQALGSLFYLLAQTEEEAGSSTEVIQKLRTDSETHYRRIMDHLPFLEEKTELYFKKAPKYSELYWNELPMIQRDFNSDPLGLSILTHLESLGFIFQSYADLLTPYADRFDVKSLKTDQQITAYTRFESFYSQAQDMAMAFDFLINPKENFCRSMRFHADEGYVFLSSPIDIGKVLHDTLLQTSASVVYTSATLANGNGDTGAKGIEWATGYSYLNPERRFKTGFYLPQCFDYKNKTKIFLVDDVPPLYEARFVETTLKPIIKLIRELGGRTLLLYSAKTRFETAREILLKEFEGHIPVFIQGMGSDVVEEFKASGNGILLGMESFGEGIDIPGKALQFVFVDKIPDMRLDLVIQERRNFFDTRIGNEFSDYYLAHRTRSLHQKLGRLLRTENDYGGVIIVDSRVKQWKGKTMEKLVKLMEPYDLKRASLDDACEGVLKFVLEHE